MKLRPHGLVALVGVCVLLAAALAAVTIAGSTRHRSGSCTPAAFRLDLAVSPPAVELSTPLAPALLSSFEIFRARRPPAAALPGVLDRTLSRYYELSGFYPAYVRQLARLPSGRRYLVIPAFGAPQAVPPAHCLPAAQRHTDLEQQHRRAVEPVYCILEVAGRTILPTGCEPFAAIDEGGGLFEASDFTEEPLVELVPDGVASLRITYRGGSSIVVPVHANALVSRPPLSARLRAELSRLLLESQDRHLTGAQRLDITRRYDGALAEANPVKLEWLDAAGRVLRAISAPSTRGDSKTSLGNLRAPLGG